MTDDFNPDNYYRIIAPKPIDGTSDDTALRMTLDLAESIERRRLMIDQERPVWARIRIRHFGEMAVPSLRDYGCPVVVEPFDGPKRWEIELIPAYGPILVVEADS